MTGKIKIIIPVIFLLLITGCGNNVPTGNEKPEVLLATDCGQDKLQCCQTEPKCLYAQACCPDPNNPKRDYCSDTCTFGKKDEFCRKDEPKCDDGFVCTADGYCKACGQKGELCCGGDKCGDGSVCHNNKCVECGLDGNPCCAENKCGNDNKIDDSHNECLSGICNKCGAATTCAGTMKCLPGYLYNNDSCFQCGESSQPCCDKLSGKPYDCNPKNYVHCYKGFCME